MELIIFACLYQAKEGLIFYVHFFTEELSIYVARQNGIGSLNINKASAAKNSEVPMTLSGAVLRARLCKAESYILWLHSPYTPARSFFFFSTNRLASSWIPLVTAFTFPSHWYALKVFLRTIRGLLLWVGASLTVLTDQSK